MHENARLTVHGRVLLVRRVVEEDWTVVAASEAAGVSVRTGFKWLARFRAGGERMLHDRSSAPGRMPHATPVATIEAVEGLRRRRLSGPAIARELGLPRSTVGAILRRLGLGRVSALDPRAPENRYERRLPGELIHVDTKKLGRIQGIGHRITGDRTRQSNRRGRGEGLGWERPPRGRLRCRPRHRRHRHPEEGQPLGGRGAAIRLHAR
ncbi:leucine zipper domain-containing protein [Chelatococcus asaccharovorans]|uniref:leucine zipper domain-containing protein n=1 Tax=Chelatococcus asaccharovorans TaxID=28210 RepID=UPI001FEBAA98|nr:leucine zipper domain-containing protein [Chelatococcus asaccharovorans]